MKQVHTPAIPESVKSRQEVTVFSDSLTYVVIPCFRISEDKG